MEVIHSDHAPAALGPYSQAMRVGNLIYTSGQIGIDPAAGKITSDTVEGQAAQVCANLRAVLAAAGTDLTRVVKTTCFLADMGDLPRSTKSMHVTSQASLPAPVLPQRLCPPVRSARSKLSRRCDLQSCSILIEILLI